MKPRFLRMQESSSKPFLPSRLDKFSIRPTIVVKYARLVPCSSGNHKLSTATQMATGAPLPASKSASP